MIKSFHSLLPILICLATGLFASVPQTHQFWADEIDSALKTRSEFLESIDLTEKDFLSLESWINSQQQQFSKRVSSRAESRAPWYFYLAGVLESQGSESQNTHFKQAIRISSNHPGTLWLLSLEFIRNDQLLWAEESLMELEKSMFSRGGIAAPTISQQLLLAGKRLEPQSKSQAEFCFGWAKQFDPDQSWSALQNARIHFPLEIVESFTSIGNAFNTISRSWRAQHALAFNLYRLLRTSFIIFILVIAIQLSLNYLPSAVHVLDDKLFSGLPLKYRPLASIAVVLSVVSFGIVPFLWALAFLVRRFLSKGEKSLLTFACLLLTLSPLDNWMYNVFLNSASSSQTPHIFTRVTTEGYSEELHQAALKNARENPSDHLAYLGVAISAVKGEDHNTSAEALRKALQLSPKDPLTLLTAGNISFLLGNHDAVEQYYTALIEKDPRNLEAKFNMGQYQIEKGGSITATDLIDQAARLYPRKVNRFIEKNDIHYSGNSPLLRRLMQPELSPKYFWLKRFLHHGGSLSDSKPLWGASFFGLGPIASLILFVLFFASLLFLDRFIWNSYSKVKELFNCKICGRIICRKCRKGTKCEKCHEESQYVRNASSINAQQRAYIDASRKRKNIMKSLFGLTVPGSDKLIKGDKTFSPAIHVMLSCLVLSLYYTSSTFQTRYPQITTINLMIPFSVFMIYNLLFIIKHGLALKKTLTEKKKA